MEPYGNYIQRLQTEFYSHVTTKPPPGIAAFPTSEESLTEWTAIITGPQNTPFENLKFKVYLYFPNEYPFKPPFVKFHTKMFHPNIDSRGNVCLDILKDNWSPVYNIRTILISLQVLLGEPNNESPLNWSAAEIWGKTAEYSHKVNEVYDYTEEHECNRSESDGTTDTSDWAPSRSSKVK